MILLVVDGGVIYISYKLGNFEGERNGRFFLDVTANAFRGILGHTAELIIIEEWFTDDVRPEKQSKWYNVILKKR